LWDFVKNFFKFNSAKIIIHESRKFYISYFYWLILLFRPATQGEVISSSFLQRGGFIKASSNFAFHLNRSAFDLLSIRDPIQSRLYRKRYGQLPCKKEKIKIQQIAADVEFCHDWELPCYFRGSQSSLHSYETADPRFRSNAKCESGSFKRAPGRLHIYFNLMRVRVRARCRIFYAVIIFIQCRRKKAGLAKSIEKCNI